MVKHCFSWIGLAVVVLSMVVGAARALAQPELVGAYGAPERLRVEGVRTFDATSFRIALLANYEVMLAAHPSSSYEEYTNTLAMRCQEACRHRGFARARVEARFEPKTGDTVLTVSEGTRFEAGELRVTGAEQIDVDELMSLMQRGGPPKGDGPRAGDGEANNTDDVMEVGGPLWSAGEPVSFSKAGDERRRAIVAAALAELGFHDSQFRCELSMDETLKRADLTVVLVDEGKPAMVERAEVRGLERSSRDAVIRALGWRPGALVTRRELQRMNARLRDSGRFITHDVRLASPTEGEAGYRLDVDVLEVPGVTPLGESLSDVEETLLKFHRWSSEFASQGHDLVLRRDGEQSRTEAILSTEHGAMFGHHRLAPETAEVLAKHTVVFSNTDIGYYVDAIDQYLLSRAFNRQIHVQLRIQMTAGEDRHKHPKSISFGLGRFRHRDEGNPRAVLDVRITPSFCLAMAHMDNAVSHVEDGVLTIESDTAHVQMHVETGELIKYVAKGEAGVAALSLTVERHAMQTALDRLQERSHEHLNAFDSNRPISSVAEFFIGEAVMREWAALRGDREPVARPLLTPDTQRVLATLIDKGLLWPWDELVGEAARKNAQYKMVEFMAGEDAATGNGVRHDVAKLARGVLPLSDVLFERQSWPWTLYRETCLIVAGDARHTAREIARLGGSPDSGPLCLLVTAELLGMVSPEGRRATAAVGLRRLGESDFRNEFDVLLNRDFVIGQSVFRLAEILRHLDAQDVAALGRLLFDEDGDKFVDGTRRLRQQPNVPIHDVLPDVLAGIWTELLAPRVRVAMRSAAGMRDAP